MARNKQKNRQENINILIICAETEKAYLEAYFKKFPLPSHIKITNYYISSDTTPNAESYEPHIRHNDKAYRVDNKYIYHIFDLERPVFSDGQVQGMLAYVQKCKKGKIIPVLQMPSIEVWFLLHFIDTLSEFSNADSVETELKKYFTGYDKNNTPCWNNVINESSKAIEKYNNKKENYASLDSVFLSHNITNPMMQIGDLIQELPKLK